MKKLLCLWLCIFLLAGSLGGLADGAGEITYQAGDVVTFGRYWTQLDDTLHPIEWLVVEANEQGLVLLSRYALDSQPFNQGGGGPRLNWGNSTICTWLNGYFLETAFTDEEKQSLVEMTTTDQKQQYSSLVMLPWKSTVTTRLPEEKLCKPTQYAKDFCRVSTANGYCEYWVRDYSSMPVGRTVLFGSDGADSVHSLNDKYIGVRPLITVDLHTAKLSASSEDTPPESVSPASGLPAVGDVVTFGLYEIKEANLLSPIQWYVIDSNKEAVLLVSVYALYCETWDQTSPISGTAPGGTTAWDNSYLRGSVNGVFVLEAFSTEEREMLLTMTLKNADGSSATDRVLLLSSNEAASVFKDLRCEPTPYLRSIMKLGSDEKYVDWWTRTDGPLSGNACFINRNGNPDYTTVTTALAIRPVIALDPAWFQQAQ